MPWVRIVCAMGEKCVCQSIYLELVSRWHTQHTQILAHTILLPPKCLICCACTGHRTAHNYKLGSSTTSTNHHIQPTSFESINNHIYHTMKVSCLQITTALVAMTAADAQGALRQVEVSIILPDSISYFEFHLSRRSRQSHQSFPLINTAEQRQRL